MAAGWQSQYLRYRKYFLNIAALYQKRPDIRMFVEIILTLSTIILFSLFAIKPTVLTIIDLVNQISAKKDTITILDSKISALTTARTNYNRISDFIPAIEQAIPKSPSIETYIENIYALTQENNLEILGVSVGQITIKGEDIAAKKIKGLKPLPDGSGNIAISISVKGDYLSTINLVKGMENLRRPIKVDSFDIGTTSSKNAEQISSIVSVVNGRLPYTSDD